MLPTNVLYYGTEEPPPEGRELRAGPLSLRYEAGELRYIRLGDREIVRRIYVAVRDRNWGTVPAILAGVRMEVATEAFRITFDATHRRGAIDFAWRGTIAGEADGTITCAMEGVARSTFLRNRIGFCVLHPIRECAGQPCTVEHADGTVERGQFPLHIAPHQPFAEMRAIAHEVLPGVRAEVRFAGDIFEMEDQRNWTDASYKTYCTPLRLPFPVEVAAGATVAQAVTLTLHGAAPAPAAERDEGVVLAIGGAPAGPLPRIGLGLAGHDRPLGGEEIARLKALGLAHLRVDLRLAEPVYTATLRRAATEAGALGVPLELALFLSDAAEDELAALVATLEDSKAEVCRALLFPVSNGAVEGPIAAALVALARRSLGGYDRAIAIGAGTNGYFTHLNRSRPSGRVLDLLDLVCYSFNPQVHAFDNASLVETLAAQAATVESARQFAGGLPLAVTPVTLRPRSNPDATGPEPAPAPGELPAPVDARQMSLLGAGWTMGSVKSLAEGGVASVTLYETTGWRGVMETPGGSPLPERFRSAPGAVFPLYHVLADLGEFAGGEVVPVTSSDMLRVEGLALERDGGRRVLLANLTAEAQEVTVRGLGARTLVRALDETNAVEAMRSPEEFRARAGDARQTAGGALDVRLRPYAVARLDVA